MKRGAFASLMPLKVQVFKYKQHLTNKCSYTQDVMGFEKHQFLDASIGAITAKLDVLPTFCPNDYFWEHHWKEGEEEKWEAYARAIQTIMAEHLGVPMSDSTMEDKLAYKKEMKRLAKGGIETSEKTE
jgi:hypothetical protein